MIDPGETNTDTGSLSCGITVAATPERLFELWTTPEHIQRWWGPEGVDCPFAEVDLRVGGKYRIANRMSDGSVLWISGHFEEISPLSKLVYSWRIEGDGILERPPEERVTVTFTERGSHTDVSVLHEQISSEEIRKSHRRGWQGCLDALADYLRREVTA